MTTPTQLRLIRARHRWSQADLAAALDVSRISISNWERGVSRIPLRLFATIGQLDRRPVQDNPWPRVAALSLAATLESYASLRSHNSHVAILRIWRDANFTPSREAQQAIAAAWPDILQTTTKENDR